MMPCVRMQARMLSKGEEKTIGTQTTQTVFQADEKLDDEKTDDTNSRMSWLGGAAMVAAAALTVMAGGMHLIWPVGG